MPYQFGLDSTNQILYGAFEGPITDQEMKDYYRAAVDQINRTDPSALITDFSGVTSFDVSAETMRSLAKYPTVMPNPLRPRLVVAPSTHIFGMLRLYQLHGESTRGALSVVRSLQEAFSALGIGTAAFKPLSVTQER